MISEPQGGTFDQWGLQVVIWVAVAEAWIWKIITSNGGFHVRSPTTRQHSVYTATALQGLWHVSREDQTSFRACFLTPHALQLGAHVPHANPRTPKAPLPPPKSRKKKSPKTWTRREAWPPWSSEHPNPEPATWALMRLSTPPLNPET